MLSNLANLGRKLLGKVLTDRTRINEAQSRINEAEVAGAPQSVLRLWRSFLGYMLVILLFWEIPVRLILIPMFMPEVENRLPPSCLDAVLTLLMGMLGLGL